MNILELLIGQLPEAMYFAVFLIKSKNITKYRILFVIAMILEYFLLKINLHFTIYFQILYCFLTYLILKLIYKNKAQITDIFLFMYASIILILCSLLGYIISYLTVKSIVFASILKDLLMFSYIILRKNKIREKYQKYCSNWNRKSNQKIRSLTIRNISIIIFNVMFYLINLIFVFKTFFDKLGMR